MSMAIGHFAVGTSFTMVAFHILPRRIRFKMVIAQVFITILAGLWAMLPDIAQFTNVMHHFNDNYWRKISLFQHVRLPDLTVFINLIRAFHNSLWANICFFHQLMDVIDKNDSILVSAVLILAMVLIVSVTSIREFQDRHSSRNEY